MIVQGVVSEEILITKEKQTMKMSIECYPCLLNQVLSTTRLCQLSDEQRKDVMNFTLRTMAGEEKEIYPQEIVVEMYRYMHAQYFTEQQRFDPYKALKQQTREIATRFYETVHHRIQDAAKPLEMAVKCAALGNIIDFGAKAHGNIDVESELHKLDELEFAVYDFAPFKTALQTATNILYIGDNVGEDVFDKACIAEIKSECPGANLVFATREIPIINDTTVEDVKKVGMADVARVISSGSIYPGTILDRVNDEFLSLFRAADLVISKGQGNYETLQGEQHPNLFFLLRAKCDKVADALDVRIGSMILKKL